MRLHPLKVGVLSGLLSALFLPVPLIDLFMGGCFYEEGCGNQEWLGLLSVAVATCIVAILTGWLVKIFIEKFWG
jgi:putative effector of murein hydrolase LrgA (UPF0299 family)